MNPAPLLVTAVQVLTRSGEFALAKPARETYYTRIERELRYKSKNFIDTVVYRGGDLTIAWVHDGLQLLGFAKAGIAGFGAAMAALAAGSAAWMVWIARGLPADAHESGTDGPR
jgi:AAA family ATP:ADP antiporter